MLIEGPAIGCMRLSTSPDRDDERSVALLREAVRDGVAWLDTAPSYGLGEADEGHNERLIERALGPLPDAMSDSERPRVATKAGLRREGRAWVPDGRAKAIEASLHGSRERLQRETLDLLQLHAPDPRVPFDRTVRALGRLYDRGFVHQLGLCNVSLPQLRRALELAPIACVQIALSPFQTEALRSGLVAFCRDRGIGVLAYAPFGGPKRVRRLLADPMLVRDAAAAALTPSRYWLAVLRQATGVVPLPGPTRTETLVDAIESHRVQLEPPVLERVEAHLGMGAYEASVATPRGRTSPVSPSPAKHVATRVLLVMGIQGSGKTRFAMPYERDGWARLNRDAIGGTMAQIAGLLRQRLEAGQSVVLDNTFATRAERQPFVAAARAHGARVEIVYLDVPLERAQRHVCERLVGTTGGASLEDPVAKRYPADVRVPPRALFSFQRRVEPPEGDEGFDAIRVETPPLADAASGHPGLLLDLDSAVWASRSGGRAPSHPGDVVLRSGVGPALQRLRERGFRLCGTTWQPGVEEGTVAPGDVWASVDELSARLGLPLWVGVCPHRAGPPRCWCRKPLPGLGVLAFRQATLHPARSAVIGDGSHNHGFARRLGLKCLDARALESPERIDPGGSLSDAPRRE